MASELATTPPPVRPRGRVERGGKRRLSYPMILLIIAGGLLLLSLVRALTDTGSLTDTRQWGSALGLAVPIGLAGLGGLWAERAGVINIGLEGMMMLGLFAAGWIGWQYGPWAAVLAGIIGGLLGGLVHAVATVTFGVDHIVSGVAINILALGVVQFLAKLWFGEGEAAQAGGNDKQSPRMEEMPTFTVPGISDALRSIADQGWFLVSDTAGILGAAVTNVSWITLLAILLFVGTWWVLWKTPFGLRLRSCGENPVAGESLGVNVYLYKYIAVAVSGGLAGLGGAYLAVFIRMYQDGQTGGRGYLGLATMIFGNWRPGGVAMGAGLFGFMDALQIRGGGPTVHGMLLLFAIALAGLAVYQFIRNKRVAGTVSGVLAVLLFLWYSATDTMPLELVTASPYITTLLVLALFSQHLRVPAAIGKSYRRGQGT
ncbi:ABC transporter permease [Streptomyces calidiresistens]|uniref:ABC transporter permease n=1 Tax=Streptomyces calidiresistens TaxID=1485586 RepID=A0A7W3XW90_9ACTN|nr:ABC transporter permease [Streptomyces calidiresistens]MBB0229506.1 ABC transporter permease [Streptomyces calidiresistens]